MDTKISSAYWAHREVESADPQIKLAGLWMRTNDRLTLFGYAEVTPERFAFETGLPKETLARAIEALAEWFTSTPKGYFVPGFIGEQIGRGDALLNNNVCKGLVRALTALHDANISALVLQHYPELEAALKVISSPKPLPTPPGGVREERRGEEPSRAERSGDQGGAGGRTRRGQRGTSATNGATLPAQMPAPMRDRVLQLNPIFKREPTDAWAASDLAALEASGLLQLAELDFIDQCETVRAFYAAKIPREMETRFAKRTTIQRLLLEWSGELDKGRTWARAQDDGMVRT